MSDCVICHEPLDRFDLAAAMYEGQVVRDTENQPWAGQPVCSRCFDIVGQGNIYQILRLRQEKNWRLEYVLWLFNVELPVWIVAPTGQENYFVAEAEGIPGYTVVYSTSKTLSNRVKIRSESGVLKVIESIPPHPSGGEELPDTPGLNAPMSPGETASREG